MRIVALARGLVERPDVPAVEREHHVDPELPQRGDRLVPGMTVDVRHRRKSTRGALELDR